jgi:hypothetical protein
MALDACDAVKVTNEAELMAQSKMAHKWQCVFTDFIQLLCIPHIWP